jgi:hypothetical protein
MTNSARAPIPGNLEDTSAFLATSGLHFTEVSGHLVTGTLVVGPEHHTPWGVAHGGVYTTAQHRRAPLTLPTPRGCAASRSTHARGSYRDRSASNALADGLPGSARKMIRC